MKRQYLGLFAASFVAMWVLRLLGGNLWEHPSRPSLDVASIIGGALVLFAPSALSLRRKGVSAAYTCLLILAFVMYVGIRAPVP